MNTLNSNEIKFIYDRTKDDVERVKYLLSIKWEDMTSEEQQEWLSSMKGAYNYTDMNRVEQAVKVIYEGLLEHGIDVDYLETREWGEKDIPTNDDMTKYLDNVKKIYKTRVVYNDTPIPIDKFADYNSANVIERILHDSLYLLDNITPNQAQCGEVFSGEY